MPAALTRGLRASKLDALKSSASTTVGTTRDEELAQWRRWFGSGSAIGYVLAGSAHTTFIALFAHWGVATLAWFNVFSVATYVVASLLLRRGWHLRAFALTFVEIYVHAWLCLEIVGWAFGIQYSLFAAIAAIPCMPTRKSVRLVMFVLVSALTTALFAMYYAAPSPASIDPMEMLAAHAFNTLSVLVLVGAIVYFIGRAATSAELALAAEHRKSEELLDNVLPTVIARRLKEDTTAIAEGFPSASVLFADIVGFTRLAESSVPHKLVDLLNQLFSRFDVLVAERGLEKIKTIGDAYMVASGIPVAREDHATALVELAIAMRSTLQAYSREVGTPLQLRIGISSGPVVAGVIGRRRLLYDLWGDTVNVAARMESHGLPDEIQVSEGTYALVRAKFECDERGVIDVKGKGPMTTYLVRGAA
jgi:class 3 adenylate cyclase